MAQIATQAKTWVEMSQLVKYKDIELYLQLYILIYNKIAVWFTYTNDITDKEEWVRKQCLLYKALTETSYSTANHCIIKNEPWLYKAYCQDRWR